MKRVKNVLATVLGIPSDTIDDTTSPQTVETWDSYNALMIVSELENVFQVSFTMEEVVSVTCVGDIRSALSKRGILLDEA